MYSSKLETVFVQIEKYICPNWKMYLSKPQTVFVKIDKYICDFNRDDNSAPSGGG